MLDDLDFRPDFGGRYYIVMQLLRSAMHKDAPCGNTLLFLDVCQITSQLIYRGDRWLALLAFDNDCMIVPVKQDYIGACSIMERQFANFERRMNRKAILKVMWICGNVSG